MRFDKDHTWGFRRYQFVSFMMMGIVNPLLGPLFKARGMDPAGVGWLMALFGLTALVAPPLWGMVADASSDRRRPLLAVIALSAVTFCGYYLCHTPWQLVAVTVLFGATYRAVVPMGISLTFAWAEPAGKDYSRIRMFGTAGYVTALALMAIPLTFFEDDIVFPCFILFAAVAALGLRSLPRIPGAGHRKLDWHALKLLGRPIFAVTIACTFVAQAAMAAHYAFFSQFMQADFGIEKETVVFFWAFGSVLEVVMLTQTGKLIRRFGTKWVLTAGMFGIALRLGVYATVPVVPIIFVVQGFHALTVAAVHSSTVTFVNFAAPTKWRASAQTLFEGITIGLGSAVGAVVGGFIAKAWDYPTLFACASSAAVIACIVYALFGRSVSLKRDVEESPGEGLQEQ